MMVGLSEAVERFTKSKITDNIKGCVVIPLDQINDSIARVCLDLFMQPAYQSIHIGLQNRLLLSQSCFRECV